MNEEVDVGKNTRRYFGYVIQYSEETHTGIVDAGFNDVHKDIVLEDKYCESELFIPAKGKLIVFNIVNTERGREARNIRRLVFTKNDLLTVLNHLKNTFASEEDKKIFVNKLSYYTTDYRLLRKSLFLDCYFLTPKQIKDLFNSSPFKQGTINWERIKEIKDLSPYAEIILLELSKRERKELNLETIKSLLDRFEVDSEAINRIGLLYKEDFYNYCFKNGFQNLRFESKFEEAMLSSLNFEERKRIFDGVKDHAKDLVAELVNNHQNRYYQFFNVFKDDYNDWLLNLIKSEMPYVVFDLSIDGKDIKDFAYITEGNIKAPENIELITRLRREIKKSYLIVGYNIKNRDLDILKEVRSEAFIWDTLEIEMLLDPGQYSYSLNKSNDVKKDTELIDDLFWDQLYRISCKQEFCSFLFSWLPQSLKEHIKKILGPALKEAFSASASNSKAFFHSLPDTSARFVNELEKIKANSTDGSTLIVAPKSLWGVIAEYLRVSFYDKSGDYNYKALSLENVLTCVLNDELPRMILKRLIYCSKTPILANISQYIKDKYFSDDILSKLVVNDGEWTSNIICCNIDGLKDISERGDFKHVYFVGSDVDDRISHFTLEKQLSISDFFKNKCWVPMKTSGSNYILISEEERAKLNIEDLPDDVDNVWAERQPDGLFRIGYNIDYSARIDRVKKSNNIESLGNIKWNDNEEKHNNVFLVKPITNRKTNFDISMYRVGAGSRYRSLYYTVQMRFLKLIHENEPNTPIIYIIDNKLEIPNVENHARELEFFVPKGVSLAQKFERISRISNALLVVSADQLSEILSFKDFSRYVYVWDNLSAEKCMVMWKDPLSYGDAAVSNEKEDVSRDYVTPKNCMLSAWPIITFQNRLIKVNNPDSKVYVIEPFLDDYDDLAKLWRTESWGTILWDTEDEYEKDKNISSKHYANLDDLIDENDFEDKMNIIRNVFIPDFEWRSYQIEPLKEILKKEQDCLISIPTGGGKSILFQGPALYYSAFTNRLSLVITPLRALMQDQVNELHDYRLGFFNNTDFLNSDLTPSEVQQIYRKILGGEISLLYVTPERFRSKRFIEVLEKRMAIDNGLEYFIFDEAHCISQWGLDFRPDYLHAVRYYKEHYKDKYPQSRVIMFSATVTEQIQKDIEFYFSSVKRLGQEVKDYNPIREHIEIKPVNTPYYPKIFITKYGDIYEKYDISERYLLVADYIKNSINIDPLKSRMLVFCRTHHDCEDCSALLSHLFNKIGLSRNKDGSIPVGFFHAGMDFEDRVEAYEKFKKGEIVVLCATKAFGMGMDIPNIHYILHLSPPSVFEDYLQEVGRIGRNKKDYENAGFTDGKRLPAACLYNKADFGKAKELINNNMLSWSDIEKIRTKIVEYIEPLQNVENACRVIVPENLWRKDENDDGYVNFKLGMHWLERAERIETGFRLGSFVNISILKKDVLNKANENNDAYNVYDYIAKTYAGNDHKYFQVLLSNIKTNLNISYKRIYDALLRCYKDGWLDIKHYLDCEFTKLRFDETDYKLSNNSCNVALDYIFESISELLDECKEESKKEIIVDPQKCKKLLEAVIDKMPLQIFVPRNKKENYMTWYNENNKNIGISKEESFKKDLLEKRSKHILTILKLLHGVNVKPSYYGRTKGEKIVSISDPIQCKKSLTYLKSKCLDFLQFVKNNGVINLGECITKLDVPEDAFSFFNDVIRVLKLLSYIRIDRIFPGGIEISTNPKTVWPLDQNKDKKVYENLELLNAMRVRRLKAMEVFLELRDRTMQNEFISKYFNCNDKQSLEKLLLEYCEDGDNLMDELQEKAIEEEENRLGAEQKVIYNAPVDENINVMAGPGSGKTHVLMLRCARLIYRDKVKAERILVLAYNRAVIVEIKNRLEKLFKSLGLGRVAGKLNIYTFDALARKICGKSLDGIELEKWEDILLDILKNSPSRFKQLLPDIEYILIDEFQDITQTRINAMIELKKIYRNVRFFTIGDKNQSIYGFDKKIEGIPDSIAPDYYYKQLKKIIKPQEYSLRTNYRSYPKILETAKKFLKNPDEAPIPWKNHVKNEPKSEYVKVIDWENGIPYWTDELPDLVKKAKGTLKKKNRDGRIENIAIFFRTNDEVYRGYQKINELNLEGVKIRIQGASEYKPYRIREIYEVILYLMQNSGKKVELENDQTQKHFKSFIKKLSEQYPKWDTFYLDFTYTLILDFLESIASDDEIHTYGDIADFIQETANRNDGQMYKIYDKYESERIWQDKQVNIILTTIHKIKGLEFDAVIVTPSYAELPLKCKDTSAPLTREEEQEMEEERRVQYVAYTRAKKILWAYRWNREKALDNNKKIENIGFRLGFNDIPDIKKFYLSFMAKEKNFKQFEYIKNQISRNDQIDLYKYENSIYVKHKGMTIGKLSGKSVLNPNYINRILSGFFVNEIYALTYEETKAQDERDNTNFAEMWCDDARNQGYIYIVNFSGYGNEKNI